MSRSSLFAGENRALAAGVGSPPVEGVAAGAAADSAELPLPALEALDGFVELCDGACLQSMMYSPPRRT